MPNFLLSADEMPIAFLHTLDQAKSRASEFIRQGDAVRIDAE